jgi:cytochrome c biogenesis protein
VLGRFSFYTSRTMPFLTHKCSISLLDTAGTRFANVQSVGELKLMATIDQTAPGIVAKSDERPVTKESLFSRFLRLLCSVRLGVTLLILLALACLVGMLVMQQNVDGFARYFAELTPAQRLVYSKLGLFDIYHAWYFNALLCLLSLNIILASIDRFPRTWLFVSKPTVTVPARWLRDQKQTAEFEIDGEPGDAAQKAAALMKRIGWRKIVTTQKGDKTYVFGQSGVWNRFGAYAVHVGLLVIFAGGFLTAQLGTTGQLPLAPGQRTNILSETVVELDEAKEVTKRLPFEIQGIDLQQKLIKKEGPISAMNTIDWITTFTIKDETGTHEATAQMNRPFDYRGYRFFQASFIPVGRARNITITAKSGNGDQTITIPRDGTTVLADGTTVQFAEFRGNFRVGEEDPNEDTSAYPNPAAVLQVTKPGDSPQTAYAFGPQMENIPVASKPVAGYTFQLNDFEKVADQHVLSVQRDPGTTVVYVGFILLFITLVAVFFFSHQRVWVMIEPLGEGSNRIIVGGNANRSLGAFDVKFGRLVNELEAK